MPAGDIERRRGRRASVQAPMFVRAMPGTAASSTSKECVAQNISLAGVFFETDEAQAYRVNDMVTASIAIPEPHRRTFPFTRIAGRGRIVRVQALPSESGRPRRVGVALEFGEQLTALTAIPPRG